MSVITSIKQQKNKNRVNVYLDDKFGFGIDLDSFVLLNLRVNQELMDEEVEKIVRKAEFQKTLDKLLRFGTLRPRSEKEFTDYFRRKKVHESMWEELLGKLKHFELLDDAKFARWWVDQRQNFKPKSARILKLELTQKGIVKEIIESTLGETKIDEVKMAKDLLERKKYKWKDMEPKIARQKKSQYLMGKGFGWEVIQKVVGLLEL
jgi:regulatory protein